MQAREVLELKADIEENQRGSKFDLQVAVEKKNPRNKSYWNNPSVDLIGKKINKDFGIMGVFVSKIIK